MIRKRGEMSRQGNIRKFFCVGICFSPIKWILKIRISKYQGVDKSAPFVNL